MQPIVGDDVWTLWQVEYRDVVILGPGNEHLGTFNLTVHDLSDPANHSARMNQLLEAANEWPDWSAHVKPAERPASSWTG